MHGTRHVVFLSPHSDPEARPGEVDAGGQCVYEYELAKVLSSNFGMRVTIYTRKKNGHPKLSLINERFSIKRVTVAGDAFIPKEKIGPYLDEFVQQVAVDLKNNEPDVIHGHYWDGGKAAILLNKYLYKEIPIVWTPHSLGAFKRKEYRGVDAEIQYNFVPRVAWESYSMLAASLIIVSTEDEKNKVVIEYGIEKEKIRVIAPGIPIANFKKVEKEEARKKLNLPQEKTIVMSLGRLDRRKGYHNCINAVAEFKRLFPNEAVVLALFTGKQSKFTHDEKKYFEELQALTRQLGIDNSVLFRDAVDYNKVRLSYAASDAYLCLSDYEPFGISILESMYMETPVIATSNGGPATFITHAHTGMLVAAHDATHAAYAMYGILRDPRFRAYLIDKAKEFVRHKYTWLSRGREFTRLYAELQYASQSEKQKRLLTHLSSTML